MDGRSSSTVIGQSLAYSVGQFFGELKSKYSFLIFFGEGVKFEVPLGVLLQERFLD